eukprot:c27623_g1_i1 orf=87-1046(+)
MAPWKIITCFMLGLLRRRRSQTKMPGKGRSCSSVADESSKSGDYRLLQDDCAKKGFASAYRGRLKDGTSIAVKRFHNGIMKEGEDFCREAKALGRIHHKNLLSLRGYCAEGEERMLVYDFMDNLSLLSHLHGDLTSEQHLDWPKRMAIAIGCAEGLVFLHHHSDPQLVHGDIKSTNVLLDSNYEPLWVDFGLSNLVRDGGGTLKGAMGYMAPEDVKGEEDLSERSDVFSYGILLLELISGKNPGEKVLGDSDKLSIVEWAQPLILEFNLESLVDPGLQGNYNCKELERLLNVAIMCAQDRPESRLSMLEVVDLLKGEVL